MFCWAFFARNTLKQCRCMAFDAILSSYDGFDNARSGIKFVSDGRMPGNIARWLESVSWHCIADVTLKSNNTPVELSKFLSKAASAESQWLLFVCCLFGAKQLLQLCDSCAHRHTCVCALPQLDASISKSVYWIHRRMLLHCNNFTWVRYVLVLKIYVSCAVYVAYEEKFGASFVISLEYANSTNQLFNANFTHFLEL